MFEKMHTLVCIFCNMLSIICTVHCKTFYIKYKYKVNNYIKFISEDN